MIYVAPANWGFWYSEFFKAGIANNREMYLAKRKTKGHLEV